MTSKVEQCEGEYYDYGKFCAAGAVMHEKYGWYGKREVRIPNRELMSIFHGGILKTILDQNDDGKFYCEVADSLEKMYLVDRI